jgi:hypothetical protein
LILFQLSNDLQAAVFQKKSKKKSRPQRWKKVHSINKILVPNERKLLVEEIGLNLLNGLWVLAPTQMLGSTRPN